jgi:hemolysin-activating ACP:hemolysin acyltransferase
MLNDIRTIISLYRQFDRYKDSSDEDIFYHILPSYQLGQYKIHIQGDKVIAFTNWAFLNQDAQNRFISTAKLNSNDWNSGNNVWHIDTICVRDLKKVMSWTKKHFKNMLGINQPIKWLRTSSDNNIYRTSTRFTKENW